MEDVAKYNRGTCYTLTKQQKKDDASLAKKIPIVGVAVRGAMEEAVLEITVEKIRSRGLYHRQTI
jgi:hypothetical protein